MENNELMDVFKMIVETFEANKDDDEFFMNLKEDGNWALNDQATKAFFGPDEDDGNLALGMVLGRFRKKSGPYWSQLNSGLNKKKVEKFGYDNHPDKTMSVKSTLCYIINNMDLSKYSGIMND